MNTFAWFILAAFAEGIEQLLERQELADLFAFLALDRPSGDPQSRPIPGAPRHHLAKRLLRVPLKSQPIGNGTSLY
jgi:hypothetical protein